jgi:Ca2+-binding EF-hand superfamily protein
LEAAALAAKASSTPGEQELERKIKAKVKYICDEMGLHGDLSQEEHEDFYRRSGLDVTDANIRRMIDKQWSEASKDKKIELKKFEQLQLPIMKKAAMRRAAHAQMIEEERKQTKENAVGNLRRKRVPSWSRAAVILRSADRPPCLLECNENGLETFQLYNRLVHYKDGGHLVCCRALKKSGVLPDKQEQELDELLSWMDVWGKSCLGWPLPTISSSELAIPALGRKLRSRVVELVYAALLAWPPEKELELKRVWWLMDLDGSGTVDAKEMLCALKAALKSDSNIQTKKASESDKGDMKQEECADPGVADDIEKKVEMANDAEIANEEMDAADKLMLDFDRDGDGRITFDEFERVVHRRVHPLALASEGGSTAIEIPLEHDTPSILCGAMVAALYESMELMEPTPPPLEENLTPRDGQGGDERTVEIENPREKRKKEKKEEKEKKEKKEEKKKKKKKKKDDEEKPHEEKLHEDSVYSKLAHGASSLAKSIGKINIGDAVPFLGAKKKRRLYYEPSSFSSVATNPAVLVNARLQEEEVRVVKGRESESGPSEIQRARQGEWRGD